MQTIFDEMQFTKAAQIAETLRNSPRLPAFVPGYDKALRSHDRKVQIDMVLVPDPYDPLSGRIPTGTLAFQFTPQLMGDVRLAEYLVAAHNNIPAVLDGLEIALKALNQIASWDEGETVNSTFDSPGDAQFARNTLRDIELILKGDV